jgi:PKHD-type hydroxylase
LIVKIPGVLSADQVAACAAQLAKADWRDGKSTAGPQSARVKANEQVFETCPIGNELGRMVVAEIERNQVFLSAALPRHVFPPLFNRYAPGMAFGAHIDNAVRTIPGTPYRIRTDLSATLFLSEPDTYDGGELVIEDGDAGDARGAGGGVLLGAKPDQGRQRARPFARHGFVHPGTRCRVARFTRGAAPDRVLP